MININRIEVQQTDGDGFVCNFKSFVIIKTTNYI